MSQNFVDIKNSIMVKLITAVFSIYFLVTMTVTLMHMVAEYRNTKDSIIKDLATYQQTFELGLATAIWYADDTQLKSIIAGMLKLPTIVGIEVKDETGKILEEAGVHSGGGSGVVDQAGTQIPVNITGVFSELFGYTFPIYYTEEGQRIEVGKTTLYSSTAIVFDRVQYGFLFIIANSIIKTLALWIIFVWMGHRLLSRPLGILTTATKHLNYDNLENFEIDIKISGKNELKVLEEAFKSMIEKLMHAQQKLKDYAQKLEGINTAYSRFVPHRFLDLLEQHSITDVKLGDHVEKEMSILFSDIRSFTTMSEGMKPEENFKFLNSYLEQMEPIVTKHQGFIDKYIGDAIMALFSTADDAVRAAITMMEVLQTYNDGRGKAGYAPIRIGIGVNTGLMMLGTVGGHDRMEGTVISDSVNLAARIEGLTKVYGSSLLISEHTFDKLQDPSQYANRFIDRVKVKGKAQAVKIYEIIHTDQPDVRDKKLSMFETFEKAWNLYQSKQFKEAEVLFHQCVEGNPEDQVAHIYVKRCQHYQKMGYDVNWEGITQFDIK
ncbi:MAG: adenylate/guanylate cyclase domain-containing protein [SAR324 cluster bacterium]|nr:adenylate/guanylate cyclase domain-containing protein [SAR324 cluster bacterium]